MIESRTQKITFAEQNLITFAERKFPIVSRNVCEAPSGAWGVRCPVRKCLSCKFLLNFFEKVYAWVSLRLLCSAKVFALIPFGAGFGAAEAPMIL